MRLPNAIRRLTTPVVGRVPVPVASGVNRGLWWSLASAGSGHATGRRTARQLRMVRALLREGETVWDIGAHHGYHTLCAARRVGERGVVHAFEPSAANRWFLARHLAWNGARNVVVHPLAVGAHDGEAYFGGDGTSRTYALGRGSEVVPIRMIATLLADGTCPPPTFVKVDVEGAEADVLECSLAALPPSVRLLVAMHNVSAYERCAAALRDAGFRVAESRGVSACRAAGRWHSDPDVYAAGPAYADAEREMELLRQFDF